ncbi:MAG: DNA/RNA non-specific endonuclease [Bacteroidia bacterium]
MQKPFRNIGVAFLFCAALLTGCERYDPNAKQSKWQQQTQKHSQQAEVQPARTKQDTFVITPKEKNNGYLDPDLPVSESNDQIVRHLGYTLSYNEEHEIANWVAYTLTSANLRGKEKRSEDFREDPAVHTQSAEPEDYKYSGYDRGHLAPAGDMKWSPKAMSESFLMSNIAPQTHAFNAGIWENLESTVRSWAKKDSAVHIVTGPVLQGNLQIIGKNKVTVPEFFYKAVLDAQEPEIKCIAFIIPNKGTGRPFMDFAVSVDSLEAVIQTDLFPGLPDHIENEIEKNFSVKQWKTTERKYSKKKRK